MKKYSVVETLHAHIHHCYSTKLRFKGCVKAAMRPRGVAVLFSFLGELLAPEAESGETALVSLAVFLLREPVPVFR
jgi:hypothetical protein